MFFFNDGYLSQHNGEALRLKPAPNRLAKHLEQRKAKSLKLKMRAFFWFWYFLATIFFPSTHIFYFKCLMKFTNEAFKHTYKFLKHCLFLTSKAKLI